MARPIAGSLLSGAVSAGRLLGSDEWACEACTFLNEASNRRCEMCQRPRVALPGLMDEPPPGRPGEASNLAEVMAELERAVAAEETADELRRNAEDSPLVGRVFSGEAPEVGLEERLLEERERLLDVREQLLNEREALVDETETLARAAAERGGSPAPAETPPEPVFDAQMQAHLSRMERFAGYAAMHQAGVSESAATAAGPAVAQAVGQAAGHSQEEIRMAVRRSQQEQAQLMQERSEFRQQMIEHTERTERLTAHMAAANAARAAADAISAADAAAADRLRNESLTFPPASAAGGVPLPPPDDLPPPVPLPLPGTAPVPLPAPSGGAVEVPTEVDQFLGRLAALLDGDGGGGGEGGRAGADEDEAGGGGAPQLPGLPHELSALLRTMGVELRAELGSELRRELDRQPQPRGVSAELLSQLPTFPFVPSRRAADAAAADSGGSGNGGGGDGGGSSFEDPPCAICMEIPEEGELMRMLPCFHRFHAHCVDNWLIEAGTCPVCKHRPDAAGPSIDEDTVSEEHAPA